MARVKFSTGTDQAAAVSFSPTVLAVVGTATKEDISINTPTEMDSVEDATENFGSGPIVDFVKAAHAVDSGGGERILGVRYAADADATAQEAAIEVLRSEAAQIGGHSADIFAAPGLSADTISTKAESVAEDIRGIYLRGVAATTAADAATEVVADGIRGKRILNIYPHIRISGEGSDVSPTGAVAGLIARNDRFAGGLAISPSNKRLQGVTTGAVKVDFDPDSSTSDLSILTGAEILVITSRRGALRTYGGELDDSGVFASVPVRRVVDEIERRFTDVVDNFIDSDPNHDRYNETNIHSLSIHLGSSIDHAVAEGILDGGDISPDVPFNSLDTNRSSGSVQFIAELHVPNFMKVINIRITASFTSG